LRSAGHADLRRGEERVIAGSCNAAGDHPERYRSTVEDVDSGAVRHTLQIAVEEGEETVIISVAGELDDFTAPPLRNAINDSVSKLQDRVLVLDLTDLTFMGSSGISILAVTRDELLRDNGKAALRVVTGGTRTVLRPLQISGFDQLLALYDSREEAATS
jgi:anti-sigma B factor antagonist